jgi:hypothetical protein
VPCDAHLEFYSIYQDPTNHALESCATVRLRWIKAQTHGCECQEEHPYGYSTSLRSLGGIEFHTSLGRDFAIRDHPYFTKEACQWPTRRVELPNIPIREIFAPGKYVKIIRRPNTYLASPRCATYPKMDTQQLQEPAVIYACWIVRTLSTHYSDCGVNG